MPLLAMLFLGTVLLFIIVADTLEKRRNARRSAVLIPMIRHIMPNVIANELVNVQRMYAYTGKIFTLGYLFEGPYQLSFPFPYPEPVVERVPIQLELFEMSNEDE